jgi:hypothetical protein
MTPSGGRDGERPDFPFRGIRSPDPQGVWLDKLSYDQDQVAIEAGIHDSDSSSDVMVIGRFKNSSNSRTNRTTREKTTRKARRIALVALVGGAVTGAVTSVVILVHSVWFSRTHQVVDLPFAGQSVISPAPSPASEETGRAPIASKHHRNPGCTWCSMEVGNQAVTLRPTTAPPARPVKTSPATPIASTPTTPTTPTATATASATPTASPTPTPTITASPTSATKNQAPLRAPVFGPVTVSIITAEA